MIEYRPILGFPDYIVSNYGTVVSMRLGKFKVLKPDLTPHGYHTVKLYKEQKTEYGFFVHRLVLETFVGPCPTGMQTRHLDGVRLNNFVENLAWGTSLENACDRVRHGTNTGAKNPCRGEENNKAKLTEKQVKEIVSSSDMGISLAEKFGVTPTAISGVRRGLTWRHVTGFSNKN